MAARKQKAKKRAVAKGSGRAARGAERQADEGEETPDEGDGEDGGEAEAEAEGDGDAEELEPEVGFIDTTAEVVDDTDALPEPKEETSGSLARVDPLTLYMREVQRHPLLTAEETQALAVRYLETQDVDAAARL